MDTSLILMQVMENGFCYVRGGSYGIEVMDGKDYLKFMLENISKDNIDKFRTETKERLKKLVIFG